MSFRSGRRDKRRTDEVIGANEIKRICALIEETTLSFRHDVAARPSGFIILQFSTQATCCS